MIRKNKNRLVAIIEARMASERLPGKILLSINGTPAIMHLVNRLKVCKGIDEIVIATTTSSKDDTLCEFLSKKDIKFYRGSELDVLSRIYDVATDFDATHILKFGADCPFVDVELVKKFIRLYSDLDVDFFSNTILRSYPDGMDVGIMKYEALKRAHLNAKNQNEREHTSLYVRLHPEEFSSVNISANPEHYMPELPLTLDTIFDYEFLNDIATNLNMNNLFSLSQILKYIQKNPSLVARVKEIARKGDN